MGDNITIDWSQAGRVPDFANAFATGFSQGRQISLAKQADAARADLIANPTDINALSQYALFDPQGSQAFQTAQDFGRAAQARAAAGQFAGAWANGITPGMSPQTVAGMQGQASPPAAAQDGAQEQSASDLTQHPAFQQIGSAALSGQLGMGQAAQALASSDPDMFSRMVASLATMDEAQRAKLADANGAIGSAAYTLLNTPQDQWGGVIQTLTPQLLQHGVTQAQIDSIVHSPNPQAALTGLVGQSIGVKEAMDQVTKRAQLGIEAQNANTQAGMLAEEIRQHNIENQKGIQTFGGDIINPITGQVIYSASGASGGAIPYSSLINAEGGTNPDGSFRTSSKGALGPAQLMPATAPVAMKLAGYDPTDQRWRTDPQVNMAAGQAYYNSLRQKYGDDLKAAAAYNAGPGAVDKAVASGGANWLSKLPAETQAYVEKVSASSGNNAIEGQAQAIAHGNQMPLTGRAAVTGIGARIMARVYQINPNYDSKTYKGESAALTNFLGGQNANLVRSMSVTMDHLDTLGQAMHALDNGNLPRVNRLWQGIARETGQPAPTNFLAARPIVAAEIAKAVVGNRAAESDRDNIAASASVASSPAQLIGYVREMQQLMGGQVSGLHRQYAQTTGKDDFNRFLSPAAVRLMQQHEAQQQGSQSGGNAIVAVNSPQEAMRMPSGTLFRTPDGQVRRKH